MANDYSNGSASPSSAPSARFAIPFVTGVVLVGLLAYSGHRLVDQSNLSAQLEPYLNMPREMQQLLTGETGGGGGIPANLDASSIEQLASAAKEAQSKYETAKKTYDTQQQEKAQAETKQRIERELRLIEDNKVVYSQQYMSQVASEVEKNKQRKKQETETKKKKPMNIVLLYADDWRHDSIGAAGTQIVKTPVIDQLAREGMRFTHNCVTTSVCWISRATLYSGQYMRRHKTTMPNDAIWYKDWGQSWPTLLKEAGYHQGHVGKWHFDGGPVSKTWDFWRSYYGCHYCGNKHITKMNEEDALDFLKQRPQDKPFLLSVCFFAPHSQDGNPKVYIPQNESLTLYQDVSVPVPESFTDQAWLDLPWFFEKGRNEGRLRWTQRFNEPEKYQHMMKNYYRLISEVDYASGKVIEELEKQGVLDNTLIIFTTDNGYFHAEHGLAGKWYPHQESIRVPLVIKDPRMPANKIGTLNDEFTLSIDLASTILGAAGVEPGSRMQGRDIADLYVPDPTDPSEWRKQFFYEHPVHLEKDIIPASEALVRKDYKYMYWPDYNVEQFFDLKADPLELKDLINSTEHQELIKVMRHEYKKLQKMAE